MADPYRVLLIIGLQAITRPSSDLHLSVQCSGSPSDPLLHGALAVQYVALRALPPELENSVEEDHHAQGQDTGDSNGHRFLCAPRGSQFDDNIHIAIVILAFVHLCGAPVEVVVSSQAIASQKVAQNGPWVAGLHSQQLVVELPVLFSLVKVGKA